MSTIVLDASQTVFLARQLEEIDTKIYETKRGKLEALDLVSVKKLDPGAETYTYGRMDGRGVAKFVSNYEGHAPRVDVEMIQSTVPIKTIGDSFGYSVQEIRAAQFAGIGLEESKALIAKRAIDEKLNSVAMIGDSEQGILGMLNQTGVNTYTVPADGTGASALWINKTGAQMARDVIGLIDSIPLGTAEIEHAKRVLLPYSQFRLLAATAYSATFPDKTALQWVQIQRPNIEIRGVQFANTAGTSSTARMMAYDPDSTNMEWIVPIPFERFPEERSGTTYNVECRARAGGVVLRYPLTVAYGDGI